MEEYKLCEVCGKPYSELHHIIFRSQASYLTNIPINFMYLCPDHHRGNNSPHRNRQIDLKYKKILQGTVEGILTKEHYTLEELKNLLNISKKETEKLLNKTPIHKEGYARTDILRRLMGGKIYDIGD